MSNKVCQYSDNANVHKSLTFFLVSTGQPKSLLRLQISSALPEVLIFLDLLQIREFEKKKRQVYNVLPEGLKKLPSNAAFNSKFCYPSGKGKALYTNLLMSDVALGNIF